MLRILLALSISLIMTSTAMIPFLSIIGFNEVAGPVICFVIGLPMYVMCFMFTSKLFNVT